MLRINVLQRSPPSEPIVITGIGMITSIGADRESTWRAVCRGESGVRLLEGMPHVPPFLRIGAVVDSRPSVPRQLKVIHLSHVAAAEALADARVDLQEIEPHRFACAVSGHMGDWRWLRQRHGVERADEPGDVSNWNQFLPNSACWDVARRFGLHGPRISHSTACASGLIGIMGAVRALRDHQCDMALAGGAEAIDPLFAAGFRQMGVLAEADDPRQACRPFDRRRSGFVMGEGAAMFVMERLDHAVARGARIYAEVASGRMLAEAHHVTGLDMESETLERLIRDTLQRAQMDASDVSYINAHGTGTQQNDVMETRGIRRALGCHANQICVSSLKAMLGHLVNASGSVELALTTLALRDGFAPPTLNLTDPDPECDLDCVPLVGYSRPMHSALKLSLAFGGHLVAIALRRYSDAHSGFGSPALKAA